MNVMEYCGCLMETKIALEMCERDKSRTLGKQQSLRFYIGASDDWKKLHHRTYIYLTCLVRWVRSSDIDVVIIKPWRNKFAQSSVHERTAYRKPEQGVTAHNESWDICRNLPLLQKRSFNAWSKNIIRVCEIRKPLSLKSSSLEECLTLLHHLAKIRKPETNRMPFMLPWSDPHLPVLGVIDSGWPRSSPVFASQSTLVK